MLSLLYFTLLLLVYTFSFPFILLFSFTEKYKLSLPARFLLWKNPPFQKKGIWFHACSFGEVRSLKPIIDNLEDPINISVITNTGYEEAKKYNAEIRFLPFELILPFWVTPQKVLVVSEAELWYMLFFVAKRRGIKTVLINARISDRSYKSYKRFAFFYKRIFKNIDKVFAQSQKDAMRLKELGAKNIIVNGNIKSFQKIEVKKEIIKPNKKIITLASTHKNEEALILENLSLTKDQVIVVVPRHPERFDEVDLYLKTVADKHNLTYSRYSQSDTITTDIVLVDLMGELINIYSVSDIVFLGGRSAASSIRPSSISS